MEWEALSQSVYVTSTIRVIQLHLLMKIFRYFSSKHGNWVQCYMIREKISLSNLIRGRSILLHYIEIEFAKYMKHFWRENTEKVCRNNMYTCESIKL